MASRERSWTLLSVDMCAPELEPVDAFWSGLDSRPEPSASRSASKSRIFLSRWSSQCLLERNFFTNLFSLWTSLSRSRLVSSNERWRAEWRDLLLCGGGDLCNEKCVLTILISSSNVHNEMWAHAPYHLHFMHLGFRHVPTSGCTPCDERNERTCVKFLLGDSSLVAPSGLAEQKTLLALFHSLLVVLHSFFR